MVLLVTALPSQSSTTSPTSAMPPTTVSALICPQPVAAGQRRDETLIMSAVKDCSSREPGVTTNLRPTHSVSHDSSFLCRTDEPALIRRSPTNPASAAIPIVTDGYLCYDSTPREPQTEMEIDQTNDDDGANAISPRSSTDESHGYKSDGSWDDEASNDSFDEPPSGPLWPENAYRREMLDLSINKLQGMTTRPTSLRKSVLIFNTMKTLQDEISSDSPGSDRESSGDEDLDIDFGHVHEDAVDKSDEYNPVSTDLTSENTDISNDNNVPIPGLNEECEERRPVTISPSVASLWPPSQVVVPHPWDGSSGTSPPDQSSDCWKYTPMEYDQLQPARPAASEEHLFEAKRPCVSREIMLSYELLNNAQPSQPTASTGFGTTNVTQSAPTTTGVGQFDPMHHEGLSDMDLLATLGLKDLSPPFQ